MPDLTGPNSGSNVLLVEAKVNFLTATQGSVLLPTFLRLDVHLFALQSRICSDGSCKIKTSFIE